MDESSSTLVNEFNNIITAGVPHMNNILNYDHCINSSFAHTPPSTIHHPPSTHTQSVDMPEYCVTGGTGFIASCLVKTLLENGHHVRTTVRNPGCEL